MQGQLILAIRLVSDAETKVKNLKYNHCWHSCSLNGTFCDCGNHFDQQYSYSYSNSSSSKDEINKYESSLSINKKPSDDTKIGVVSATVSNYDMTLKEFRRLMEKQIDDLPPSFIFLFNNGYPVSFKQEKTMKLKHVASADGIIDIRRKFSLTRCGIMSVYGEIFGFVFLDSSLSVVSIRTSVVKDLQDIHSFKSMQNSFFFCDRNGWPLTTEQEYKLTGWDLISDNMIRIRPYKIDTKVLSSSDLELNVKKTNANDRNGSTITLFEDANHVDGSMTNNHLALGGQSDGERLQHVCNHPEDHQNPISNAYYPRHSHSLNSTAHYHPHYHNNHVGNNSSPDITNLTGLNDSFYKQQHNLINDLALVKSSFATRPKPILISYVRKEAEQHARNLKTQLTSLGCDVYLDVDEIKVGMDWQDALNDAVNACEIFVPLVTPNYGLTLWTNREIKYADIKNKLIVPINFLKQWPPDVLAIQFATTQFLAWKTKEEIEEDVKLGHPRAADITTWDDKYVSRIAQQISELVKKRSVEKSFKDDELSIHELNATGEYEENANDQINSLENSIEDTLELDQDRGSEPMEDAHKEADDLVQMANIPAIRRESLHQSESTELNDEPLKSDQVDQAADIVPLSTLVSLSAFDSLPPPITRSSSVSSSQQNSSKRLNFNNDSILNTLNVKSLRKEAPDRDQRRTIKQPVKHKKLIVISAHPAQRRIVDSIRNKLSQNYMVWSSLDITSTMLPAGKDEVDRSDRFSASLNSLSSSVTNSVDTEQEINDFNSTVSSVQTFSQILSGNFDDDQLNKLDSEPAARIDINTFDQSVLCHRADKQPRFDKCFYRNQMTSRKLGKSQWYIDSTDLNSQSCILQPDEIDKVNIFKEKVNEARIVIILLSEDYIQSKTSKRQFFYCDFRKQILPVNLEDIKSPSHWVSKLLDNEYLIQKSDCSSDVEMIEKVCGKLCTIIKAEEKLNCKVMDLKVQEFAENIQKKLIICNKKKLFIYVMGSTKFRNSNTKELCEKIGRCLAKKEKIILVTGGALGVADTLAQSFYEERKRIRADNRKQSSAADPNGQANKSVILHCNSDDQKIDISALDVIHILPKGEVGDLRCKYRTKEDGTFEPLPYGHTVFLGDSIEDRDCTVSRVFQFCILIEGGMGSAKIAQDFIYNENIVVPISTTGYAAAGNFISEEDCGNNITEMPSGVSETDWLKLNKRDLPICELSNTIFNIIDSLSKYHPTNVRCKLFDTINKKIYGKSGKCAAKAKSTATDVLNQFNSLFKVS